MSHPLLNVFWMMLWFFVWIMWFMLLFRVIMDLFGDRGLSGWAKVGWMVFVCILPFVGVFVYVIARGQGMGDRAAAKAEVAKQQMDDYIREAAGSSAPATSHVEDLQKLADMKSSGALTDQEFEAAKSKILSS
jgi:Short C-terminal domain/Phospholipase_D-nuclease N-terminal